MAIYINQLSGRGWNSVDDADQARAIAAAEAVCKAANVTPTAAFEAYTAQWSELDGHDGMTGPALTWIEAQQAADVALTSTWANPGAEVFCVIAA